MPRQPDPPALSPTDAAAWFAERMPSEWFTDVRALVDRDEIMVIGRIEPPGDDQQPDDAIAWFREETRQQRIAVATQAEHTFMRKVSWAIDCDDLTAAFTHLNVPVMTRLRIRERQLLDTLVGAGVAKSRSEALAWCVQLVARNETDWLDQLRGAIDAVDEIRRQGPA